jgi:hypothetical protein
MAGDSMSEKVIEFPEGLTKEQLQAVISEKLGNTLYWLSKAYRFRPPDDDTERTLLEIMAGLQNMQQQVNRVFCRPTDPASGREAPKGPEP